MAVQTGLSRSTRTESETIMVAFFSQCTALREHNLQEDHHASELGTAVLPGQPQPKTQNNLSRHMGKPTICIGEIKDADQLHSNCEAVQRLCFRYSDSTIIPLLLLSQISSF